MRLDPVHISLLIIPFIASPAAAHDWYSGLQTPSGVSCCNDGDCQRVGIHFEDRTQPPLTSVERLDPQSAPAERIAPDERFGDLGQRRLGLGQPAVKLVYLPVQVLLSALRRHLSKMYWHQRDLNLSAFFL